MNFGKLIATIETPTYPIFVYANEAGGRVYVSGEVGQVLFDTSLLDMELFNLAQCYEKIYLRIDIELIKQGQNK